MIQTIKQSDTTRISRIHVTQRAHRHPYQQLMQLHMDWQSAIYNPQIHKSQIKYLPGQWHFLSDWPMIFCAGPAYTQAFQSYTMDYK